MTGREKIFFLHACSLPSLKEIQMEKEKLIKRIQRVHSAVKRATKSLQGDKLRDVKFHFCFFAKICENTQKISQTFLRKSWRKLSEN